MNEKIKYQIIMQGITGKNVSKICREYGISRTLYYRWNKAYREQGMKGLAAKERKPKMPNQTDKRTEKRILQHAVKYPEDGPKRISYELQDEGVRLGESGIYNVLKRNGLSTRKQREAYARQVKEKHRTQESGGVTARSGSGKIQRLDLTMKNPQNARPGYLCLQSIQNMGRFPKIGVVYLYTIYDAYSRLALVKLYNRKDSIQIIEFMETKIMPLLKTFRFRIEHLVTNKSRDFTTHWERGSHSYSDYLLGQGIQQVSVSAGKEDIFRPIHSFVSRVSKEFFQQAWADETIDSFDKLDVGLKAFLVEYNFTRAIMDGPHQGRTPADVVLDYLGHQEPLPLWVFTRR
ncbi:helix-turn-helix domain-containing protein [Gorillibacterium timonense]|uniref:helix-turn-helix domain-containing protein n=1 Tax=Gorillibacterium timonense TaxID=1689269 RepID=UPI00071C99A6|nr:helix-turn-helix domain-containing protein [Gorillibacterium timonense]